MPSALLLSVWNHDGSPLGDRHFAALPIRIGRNPLSDFQVAQAFVSQLHARIEEVNGQLCVRDMGSKNGVYVRSPGSGVLERISAQTPIELDPYGFEFFLGPSVRVRIQPSAAELDEAALRRSRVQGQVLGNPNRLKDECPDSEAAVPPSLPSLPPPPEISGDLAFLPKAASAFEAAEVAAVSLDRVGSAAYGSAAASPNLPPGTGHFNLGIEFVALLGLRELADSLIPGLALETTGDVARLITKLHDTVEVFCRCFLPLREGYSQFVSALDLERAALERTRQRSPAYVAVETARDPAQVASALINWRESSLDAPRAIENIFADLMLHQVALLDGVMQGMRALLQELSPESIERALGEPGWSMALGIGGGRYHALWKKYCEHFEELAEEGQAFARLFGPEFTASYREYQRRSGGVSVP